MGGSQSQEFMVYTDAGEDLIVSCPTGDYAANLEKATSQLPVEEDLRSHRRRHSRTHLHPRQRRDRRYRRIPRHLRQAGHQVRRLHGPSREQQGRRQVAAARGLSARRSQRQRGQAERTGRRGRTASDGRRRIGNLVPRAPPDSSARSGIAPAKDLQSDGMIVVLDNSLAGRRRT